MPKACFIALALLHLNSDTNLGLFVFGILTKRQVKDKFVPIVCVLSPVICFILSNNSQQWFNYSFDFELLVLNGLLTFLGLLAISKRNKI